MFWNRKKTKDGEEKLPGPQSMPDLVGRHMVLEEKADANWIWNLKGVLRPAGKDKAFYCRIFNPGQAAKAGVKVEDWTSLDDHPELIIWEGSFDKKTMAVRREKFADRSNSAI